VALATPTLWTRIQLRPPFIKAREYLKRSAGAPLDLQLDAEDIDVHELSSQDSLLDQMPLEDFKEALDLIIPHVARWRSLELLVTTWLYMHTALARMAECPAAPMLETLQLYHREETAESDEVFSPIDLRDPRFILFSGSAPKLGGLALWGTHVDWSGSLPYLCGLVDLEMAYHTRDVRPSFKEFAQILKNSPELKTLTLCSSGPAGEGRDNWMESFSEEEITAASQESEGSSSVTDIHLPAVHSFSLAYHPAEYAIALIQVLHMPALCKVMLDLEYEDFSGFAKLLADSPLLADVNDVKIRSLPCDVACIVALLERLSTKLRKLSLNFYYCGMAYPSCHI
jgi:hypothetical protein